MSDVAYAITDGIGEWFILTPVGDADNIAGKFAVAPKGTGQGVSGPRSAMRVFMIEGGENGNFEAHWDADGNLRYRIVTRTGINNAPGLHYPFYFQIGGKNGPLVDINGVMISGPRSGPGGFDWFEATENLGGTFLLGRNDYGLAGVTAAGDALIRLLKANASDKPHVDPDGYGLHAGAEAVQITNADGSLRPWKAGTYTPGDTTPSVLGASVLEIANTNPVTITNLDDGDVGQSLTLIFADSHTIIDRSHCLLDGGVNFTSAARKVLKLVKIANGNWIQTAIAITPT